MSFRQSIIIFLAVGFITLLAGCQFIRNTPSQSTPILSPTPSTTVEAASTPDQKLVQLDLPTLGQTVNSPFTVRGQVPGNWYFEGQLVGKLLDSERNLISSTPLMAEGEWMTTNMVTFEGAMSYPAPDKPMEAILRIENDNPSGLEEMQKFAEFTITLQ